MAALGSSRRYESVDIFRGFAAISVLVYHVIENLSWNSFPNSWPFVWFRWGWMGVDLFFVISGFAVGLSASSDLESLSSSGFRISFLRKRFARVAPLHYLTLVVFLVLFWPIQMPPWSNLPPWSHLLFLHNLSSETHGSINGANWSLGVEMQFYLLIALIAPFLKRRLAIVILLIFVMSAWIWRLSVYLSIPQDAPDRMWQLFISTTQLPGTLDEFAAGLGLALLTRSRQGQAQADSITDLQRLLLFVVAGATLALTFAIYQAHATYWNYPLMVIFWKTLLAGSFSLLLWFCVSLPRMKIQTTLAYRAMRYLGTISFGIYLWHLPMILLVKKNLATNELNALTVVMLGTLGLSMLSWHFFERPIMQFLRPKDS